MWKPWYSLPCTLRMAFRASVKVENPLPPSHVCTRPSKQPVPQSTTLQDLGNLGIVSETNSWFWSNLETFHYDQRPKLRNQAIWGLVIWMYTRNRTTVLYPPWHSNRFPRCHKMKVTILRQCPCLPPSVLSSLSTDSVVRIDKQRNARRQRVKEWGEFQLPRRKLRLKCITQYCLSLVIMNRLRVCIPRQIS